MHKLKLESLQVETFETTTPARRLRGTVRGHAEAPGTGGGSGVSICIACQPWSIDDRCQPETYDVRTCGETQYFDCTLGCTRNTCDARVNSCGQYCWIEDTARCAVE